MSERIKNLLPNPLIFLSALFIVLSFPPWDLHGLIWIAFIPWFFVLHRCTTIRESFIHGLWLNFLVCMGGFYWVAYAIHQYGNLPWVVSLFGLFLFPLIGQLHFVLFSVCRYIFISKAGSQSSSVQQFTLWISFGFLYVGLDWFCPKLFRDTVGNSLYLNSTLRQIADLGGPFLLSYLIYWVNDSLWQIIVRFKLKEKDSPSLHYAFTGLIVFALSTFYGIKRSEEIEKNINDPKQTVTFGVIQGNIGDFLKLSAERGTGQAANQVLNTHMRLSDQALSKNPNIDVLVWPETAYPSSFRKPDTNTELALDQRLERYVRSRRIPLIFGGYDTNGMKSFNSLYVLYPSPLNFSENSDLQIYHKNILLPFGEYIPGTENIQWIRDLIPHMGYFGQGPGPQAIPVLTRKGTFHIGPVICFEALFPEYSAKATQKGSDLIVNITNDSWFGKRAEPYQHFALSVFRSIESRVPQIRATNTGISGFILPNGEVRQTTQIGKEEIMIAKVPIIKPIPTLVKSWGDWFGSTAFTLGVLGLLGVVMAKSNRRRRIEPQAIKRKKRT